MYEISVWLLIVINPVRSCPTKIGSLNCTDAYCCASFTAIIFITLKSPAAGIIIFLLPFNDIDNGAPSHTTVTVLSKLLTSALLTTLSIVKWCILTASLCCQFTFTGLPSCATAIIFSKSIPFSISAVSTSPVSIILSLLPALLSPLSVILKDGFTV